MHDKHRETVEAAEDRSTCRPPVRSRQCQEVFFFFSFFQNHVGPIMVLAGPFALEIIQNCVKDI